METNKHNEELTPKLSAILKKELHKAPEGYFEQLSDEVLSRIKEAPVLFGLDKRELNEAPEGYFDQLEQRLNTITKTTSVKVVSMPMKLMRWTAVAAGVCLLIAVGWMFLNDKQQQTIASVTDENVQYEDYLLEEMNDDEMIAFMTETGTLNDEENQDEVMDYLVDEIDETEFID